MNTTADKLRARPMSSHLSRLAVMALTILCLSCTSAYTQDNNDASQGSVVQVTKTDKGWVMLRNGEPYFIKGAGGTRHHEKLVAFGGNSVRTWGADNAGEILDRAHALGLTVTVGIWLEHERHGFDYNDKAAVAAQLEAARAVVEKHKDHPALLMWGLGNEMEGDGKNPAIWKAVNDIAKMVKQIDPNHPTMTVLAEIGDPKLDNFKQFCPDIDVLGVNSYGGLMTLGERLAARNLDRPFVPTEFGPLGQWEVGMTGWGVPVELTSTQKAKFCSEAYMASVVGYPELCLGGYVFNWGNKQEVTPTWYSLILEDGDATETVDAMSRHWTGQWPENRAPSISPIEMPGVDLNKVVAGSENRATVTARDPDGDKLTYTWVVQSESTDRKTGGDFEQTPPTHPEAILKQAGSNVLFKAPETSGGYRLFVYIRDGKGRVATANLPFFVAP